MIQDTTGSTAAGAQGSFYAGATNFAGVRRDLLAFDIAGNIPAGATINSATLTVNVTKTVSGAQTFTLYPVLADWGEGATVGNQGQGGAATPGSATWLYTFYNTSSWSNPGGDYDGSPSATQSIGAVGSYSFTSSTMASDVQRWLASPGSNDGWILIGNESVASDAKQFASRENPTASLRPLLTIDYTVGVPEPGTLALVGSGAAFGLLHRRRLQHREK